MAAKIHLSNLQINLFNVKPAMRFLQQKNNSMITTMLTNFVAMNALFATQPKYLLTFMNLKPIQTPTTQTPTSHYLQNYYLPVASQETSDLIFIILYYSLNSLNDCMRLMNK